MSSSGSPALSTSDVELIVQRQIGPLRRVVDELQGRVNSLEREMSELANAFRSEIRTQTETITRTLRDGTQSVVNGLSTQTTAVVAGVAATTLMIERTKSQIESDFLQTRNRLELQTESSLQIEVGKKVSDVSALRSKLTAFANDIKSRYEKSLEGAAINRDLYEVNFRKIQDDFDSKMRTIGDHIIRIREEDIAPAEAAARIPYEAAHSLPIELDLERLQLRSQSLDQTLALLKSSRLDGVLGSLDEVRKVLQAYSVDSTSVPPGTQACVEGLLLSSSIQTKLLVGSQAEPDAAGLYAKLSQPRRDLEVYVGGKLAAALGEKMASMKRRPAGGPELAALNKAASALNRRGLVSNEALTLLQDFLSAGKLMMVES